MLSQLFDSNDLFTKSLLLKLGVVKYSQSGAKKKTGPGSASVGVGAPEQHFAFATAHDGDIAASSVINAMLEAEDKQKTNVQHQQISGPPRPPAENAHSLPPSRHSRGSNDSSSEPTLFTSHFRQSIPPSAELDRPRTSAVRVFATAQRTAHQESNLDAPRDGTREARVKTSARTAEFIHYKLQGQELEAMLRLDLGSSHSPAIPPGPILFRSQTY